MKNMINVKTLTITALGLFIITIIMGIIYNSFINKPKQNINQEKPIPTTYNYLNPTDKAKYFAAPGLDDQYNKNFDKYIKDNEVFLKREEKVGQLLHFVPYKGSNFNIDYNYDTASFVVIINKDHAVAGNTEFDDFLTKHEVMSREWIRNLTINTQ